jgi:tetratricopeptide (TPR) repeat protein
MRFLPVLLLCLSTLAATAQKKKDKEKEQQPAVQPAPATQTVEPQQPASQGPTAGQILTEHFLRKYSAAARWNDFDVAKDALYDLIIENPNNDSIIFTLAYYYYENQKAASSLLVTQDLLQRDPKNLTYLELAAVTSETLGVLDRSLQYYESLYLLSNNLSTLYKIAFLQYSLKRYNESNTNADILIAKPEAATLKVVFNDAADKPKEYQMKVALLNLKGMIAQDSGDKVAARKHFQEALALAPDFVPAKENLGKLK